MKCKKTEHCHFNVKGHCVAKQCKYQEPEVKEIKQYDFSTLLWKGDK